MVSRCVAKQALSLAIKAAYLSWLLLVACIAWML